MWGSHYIVQPFFEGEIPGSPQQVVRVVAALDDTSVRFDPPQALADGKPSDVSDHLVLKSRQYVEIKAVSPFTITSLSPIMVVHLHPTVSAAASVAFRPTMTPLVPTHQYLPYAVFYAPVTSNSDPTPSFGTGNRVAIARQAGANVIMDGVLLEGPWTVVGALGAYEVLTLSIEGGHHMIASSQPVGVIVYGITDGNRSHAYPAGHRLSPDTSEK